MRLKESGPLRSENGHLVFGRVQGTDESTYYETSWPYELDGDSLLLSEGDPKPHRFRKIAKAGACDQR